MIIIDYDRHPRHLPKDAAEKWADWFRRYGIDPSMISAGTRITVRQNAVTTVEWWAAPGDFRMVWQARTRRFPTDVDDPPTGYRTEVRP